MITAPLSKLVTEQSHEYPTECKESQQQAKRDVHNTKRDQSKASASTLGHNLNPPLKRAMALAQEKGDSSWLTALPIEEHGFTLHKSAFRDALALRYGWQLTNTPLTCACRKDFTLEHVL